MFSNQMNKKDKKIALFFKKSINAARVLLPCGILIKLHLEWPPGDTMWKATENVNVLPQLPCGRAATRHKSSAKQSVAVVAQS